MGQSHKMCNHDKQTNNNTKLNIRQAQAAKVTPLWNRFNKRNVKTTLSNAIVNSNNNNNNDIDDNTSNNDSNNNDNSNSNNNNNSRIEEKEKDKIEKYQELQKES